MKKSDKIKRAVAFYTSVLLFFVILPILLAYSLGYRIDYKAFKIYKTGIIFLNSKPSGASIYVNDKLHTAVTPAQIENLNPGSYKVKVKRDGFYAWEEEMIVRPNMVTKADSIILFPVMQEMSRLNNRPSSDFIISDKGYIYYLAESGLYRSDTDGFDLRRISSYSKWPDRIIRKRFSPEWDKILCFSEREVIVIYLIQEKRLSVEGDTARVETILTADEPIVDVFWYTGSGYIIVVTEKYINVVELRGGCRRNIATLYKFSATPRSVYYDANNGSLYFMDSAKDDFSKDGKYIYRMDLRQKFFDYLMQLLLKKEPDTNYEKR